MYHLIGNGQMFSENGRLLCSTKQMKELIELVRGKMYTERACIRRVEL